MFGVAVFETIEVKGHSMLNFEVMTSKICNQPISDELLRLQIQNNSSRSNLFDDVTR